MEWKRAGNNCCRAHTASPLPHREQINRIDNTHLDCAQWESPLVTQEERLCCHSLKSKSGDGVSFDVLYFHSGLCSIYSILRTEISAFICNLISPTYKGVKKWTSEIASILHNCPIWLFICNSNVLISRMCPFGFNVTSTQATRMPQVYVEIYDPPAWFKIQQKKKHVSEI